jgi:hypothetical protein
MRMRPPPANSLLANSPEWLTRLRDAIDENLSKPSTGKQLTQLPNNAHLPLLRWRLLNALLTGPHFPVNHLQSQTWCANTITIFMKNWSEGKKFAITGHALLALSFAAECATGKNDDAIVAAFTSVAAAVTDANQDVTAFWVWAAKELVKQLEDAIIQGLTNSR